MWCKWCEERGWSHSSTVGCKTLIWWNCGSGDSSIFGRFMERSCDVDRSVCIILLSTCLPLVGAISIDEGSQQSVFHSLMEWCRDLDLSGKWWWNPVLTDDHVLLLATSGPRPFVLLEMGDLVWLASLLISTWTCSNPCRVVSLTLTWVYYS